MIAQLDLDYVRTRPGKALTRLTGYALFEGRPATTKGRWFNPVVFGWLGLWRRLPALGPVDRPVFIVGTGRSGTTALGVVLSMHPEIGFLNEPKAVWHLLHGGEDLIGSYTSAPARYRLEASDATAGVRQDAQRMFGAFLRLTGARRLLDKYPELLFRIPFVRAIFPDARFLLLVRNGWDTCRSIEAWSEREGEERDGVTHDWWGVGRRKWLLLQELVRAEPLLVAQAAELAQLTDHRQMAAVEWVVAMQEGLRQEAADPARVLRVRYEDLAAPDPIPALQTVLRFCELPDDGRLFDYARRTLVPARSAEPLPLGRAISPAFQHTMAALGYDGAIGPGMLPGVVHSGNR